MLLLFVCIAYDNVFYLVKKALSKLKVLQSLLVHSIHFSEFSLNCRFLQNTTCLIFNSQKNCRIQDYRIFQLLDPGNCLLFKNIHLSIHFQGRRFKSGPFVCLGNQAIFKVKDGFKPLCFIFIVLKATAQRSSHSFA